MNIKKFEAIAILVGSTVGAGIFALPYAFEKLGFLHGLIFLFFLTLAVCSVELCYAEMILRTNGIKEMAGYVDLYVGKLGRYLISFSLIVGITSAMTAYLIGVSTYLQSIFGGEQYVWGIVFWAIGALVCYLGMNVVGRLELIMSAGLIILVGYLSYLSFPYIEPAHITGFASKELLAPFGIILFAIGGASAIPTMRKILGGDSAFLKKAIILGISIPALIYAIFAFIVLGVCGDEVSSEAIIGLSKILGNKILLVGGFFGILAMSTSFFATSYVLREHFRNDYRLPKFFAWLITLSLSLCLFLSQSQFTEIIGFAGAVITGFQGIILITAYYHARKKGERKPEFTFNLKKYIAGLIYAVFIIGIIFQLRSMRC